jgi:Uma2 family endonuclease
VPRYAGQVTASSRSRAAHRLTPWERFIALPDDDKRELIDGELIETEKPTKLHEHIVACLVFFFRSWVRQHGGDAYASGYRVRIDARRGFFPDAQLYHPNNPAQQNEAGCERGAPDIAVEVLSEGSARYDKKTKLMGYARIGVAEYWLVSQDEASLERLVLRRGKYVVEQVLTPGDVLEPGRFPGLKVSLDELFTLPRAR